MSTIIDNLKKDSELSDKIAELQAENSVLESKISELEEELDIERKQDSYIDMDNCETYNTALGTIHVHNKTGNLKLQEEIDDFFKLLMKKYN